MSPQLREVGKCRIRGRQKSVAESAIYRSGSASFAEMLSVVGELEIGDLPILYDWGKGRGIYDPQEGNLFISGE